MKNDARKTRYTRWHALIEEQQKSGLSRKNFCEKNNLVLSQFTYYLKQIKLTGVVNNPEPQLFSPVQIQKNVSNPVRDIQIVLPNGFRCIFPYEVEAFTIKNYVEILLSC